MSDILILGYYGFKNSGDDTLLLSIIQQLKKHDETLKLCVLSQTPEETKAKYGVNAVKRNNPVALIKALLSCKMLLVGGGTLIQDGTSTKSLLYYLYVIRIALMFGKKVMLFSNGIGPLKEENYHKTKKILNKVDVITLRDELAKDELSRIGVTGPKTELTADAAFGLDYDTSCDISDFIKRNKIKTDKKYFCVSVRDNKNNDFASVMAEVCDYIADKYNAYPVFVPFQKKKDYKITEEIRTKMHNEAAVADAEGDISELLMFISGAELLIGMRLHSLIYSAICNVPLIGLVYDPKVKGFMDYMGESAYIEIDKINTKQLETLCDNCLNNTQEIKKQLGLNYKKMKSKAEKNAVIAIDLLKSRPKGKK